MLLDVQLPSFDTVMFNSRISLTGQLSSSSDNIIQYLTYMFNSKCIVVVTLLLFHCMHVPFCSCFRPFILCLSLCFIVHCFFMS